jgi:hypothetical protein
MQVVLGEACSLRYLFTIPYASFVTLRQEPGEPQQTPTPSQAPSLRRALQRGAVRSRSQPGKNLYACIYLVKTRNPAPVPNIPSSAIMIIIASPEAVRPRLACTIGR